MVNQDKDSAVFIV